MTNSSAVSLSRREWIVGAAGTVTLHAIIVGPATAQQTPRHKVSVKHDPGCGCCHAWADIMSRSGRFDLTVEEERDMVGFKKKVGVPVALSSCHTAIVEGYVLEGHVPVADIVKLIVERPGNVLGIAVPGMPVGSPGMEMPDSRRDAFEVVAFHRDGRNTKFNSYAAKS